MQRDTSVCEIEGCTESIAVKSRGWCDKHYTRWKRHGDPNHVTRRNSRGLGLEDRLRLPGWEVTERGCWEWLGKGPGERYGKLTVNGSIVSAHRLAYTLWVGPIPEGCVIRHTCDNPPCINPAHLIPGTHRDNSQDMVKRGRQRDQRGVKHNMHRLVPEQVARIRERYAAGGIRQQDLAEEYGVTQTCISAIVRGKTWRHVTAGEETT